MNQSEEATVSALVDAMAGLDQARRAINGILKTIDFPTTEETPRQISGRITGLQILDILSERPMTLPQIACDLCDLRNDVDSRRKGGGTRYQEIARAALTRLIDRGLVRKIETTLGDGLPLFDRV